MHTETMEEATEEENIRPTFTSCPIGLEDMLKQLLLPENEIFGYNTCEYYSVIRVYTIM